MRIAVVALAGLALAACGDHVSSSTALAAAPAATAATRAPTIPAAAPTASPNGPIALGTDPRVGTISGGLLAGWIYDGRTGTIARESDAAFGGTALSPSGRYALEGRDVMANGLIDRTDLWLIDTRTGTERVLYSPPADPSEPEAQPNPNIPPYVYRRSERVGSWSPDERYLAVWQIPFVSASADADGRPLVVIEVASGRRVALGETLLAPHAWRAPHTLAYVAGGGREAWLNKTLRLWTPESGARDLTTPDEVGLAPSWSTDGRLWFVRGASGPYDVSTYFAGHGIGDRSVQALDVASGKRAAFARVAGYADEGARMSDDGTLVLVLRRKLVEARTMGTPDSWLELWAARPDGSDAHPLLRVSAYDGFGYYGSYGSLSTLRWER